jgi:hypothetical protein
VIHPIALSVVVRCFNIRHCLPDTGVDNVREDLEFAFVAGRSTDGTRGMKAVSA